LYYAINLNKGYASGIQYKKENHNAASYIFAFILFQAFRTILPLFIFLWCMTKAIRDAKRNEKSRRVFLQLELQRRDIELEFEKLKTHARLLGRQSNIRYLNRRLDEDGRSSHVISDEDSDSEEGDPQRQDDSQTHSTGETDWSKSHVQINLRRGMYSDDRNVQTRSSNDFISSLQRRHRPPASELDEVGHFDISVPEPMPKPLKRSKSWSSSLR
jgi:hypothetical protein